MEEEAVVVAGEGELGEVIAVLRGLAVELDLDGAEVGNDVEYRLFRQGRERRGEVFLTHFRGFLYGFRGLGSLLGAAFAADEQGSGREDGEAEEDGSFHIGFVLHKST